MSPTTQAGMGMAASLVILLPLLGSPTNVEPLSSFEQALSAFSRGFEENCSKEPDETGVFLRNGPQNETPGNIKFVCLDTVLFARLVPATDSESTDSAQALNLELVGATRQRLYEPPRVYATQSFLEGGPFRAGRDLALRTLEWNQVGDRFSLVVRVDAELIGNASLYVHFWTPQGSSRAFVLLPVEGQQGTLPVLDTSNYGPGILPVGYAPTVM